MYNEFISSNQQTERKETKQTNKKNFLFKEIHLLELKGKSH